VRGEKCATVLFTEIHVGNAIPRKGCQTQSGEPRST